MKKLAIGLSDYKELIEDDCYYVDKTLLIKELLSHKDKVTLLCRPRRFGKTLNLSMLKYFFEKTEESNAHLFADKKIWQHQEIQKEQGSHPVIFITFKDVKEDNFEKTYNNLALLISKEFKRHWPILSSKLDEYDLKVYKEILNKSADIITLGDSIYFLSNLLREHYNKKVIVLIDEYDTPIHAAYMNNYYKQATEFIKGLLGKVLKDNVSLERSVLTGILRTAKEGIFSDLNNLKVCTILSDNYSDKFGFTTNEVFDLLKYKNLENQMDDIKYWYNGYHAGENTLIYNPWSILECIRENGKLMRYWVNTSNNKLISKLLIKANDNVKKELEDLLNDISITKSIDEGFTFEDIEHNESALWSLFLFSGYMTYQNRQVTSSGVYSCSLILPNHEIKELYKNFIELTLTQALGSMATVKIMLDAMISGNITVFEELLQNFIINSMSFYDISDKEPEKSYHMFILGLLILLSDSYEVKSNRESGYGRYDIMLIPKDKSNNGIIIEFKKAGANALESVVEDALLQINEKQYSQELNRQSIQNIIAYGIAFKGKKILVKYKKL